MNQRSRIPCKRCKKGTRNRNPSVCDECRPQIDPKGQQYDRQRGGSTARGYGSEWQRLRVHVLERDHYMCVECRQPVGTSGHVDHITSKAKGGQDEMDNLQTLCSRCHGRKTRAGD